MAAISEDPDRLLDLQDLSDEDANELRAFLEKRLWFEGKLKVLESIPPIYAFLHPILISTPHDAEEYRYDIPEGSTWRLPSREELVRWQEDRDAIEEEVLAFDGGDLSRMKEKTREVTLVPLTKPSTHLVSITLDLILLIDRLLQLLRHRSELLELTNLRLDWDDLRWSIMRDCRGLQDQLRDFVRGDGRWKPARHAPPDGHAAFGDGARDSVVGGLRGTIKEDPASHLPADEPRTPPATSLPTLPQSPIQALLSSSLSSPIKPQPPIVSALQVLQAQHRTLSTSTLKKSSSVLDRMIDIAGPLKGLGGADGPLSEDQKSEGGALPDELLDLQDDLDVMVGDIKERIQWCKLLRAQWERSEAHHASSLRAKAAAETTAASLRAALKQPATSTQHAELSRLLEEAESALPPALDLTFPSPSHAEYPEVITHNDEIKSTLTQERDVAMRACARSRRGVDWYGQLADLRSQLEGCGPDLAAHIELFGTSISGLGIQPDCLDLEHGQDKLKDWLAQASFIIESHSGSQAKGRVLAQRSSIISKRYQTLLTDPSPQLRASAGELAFPDDLHKNVDQDVDRLFSLLKDGDAAVLRAKEDTEFGNMLLELDAGLRQVGGADALLELRRDLAASIDEAAWAESRPALNKAGIQDLLDKTARAADRVPHIRRLLKEISALPSARERHADLVARLQAKFVETETALKAVSGLSNTLKAITAQTTAVNFVEHQAQDLLRRIAEPAMIVGDEVSSHLEEVLVTDVHTWTEGLPERVPFVSESPGGTLSRVTPGPTFSVDLQALDASVRTHVNKLSSRVNAALSSRSPTARDSPMADAGDLATTPINLNGLGENSLAADSNASLEDVFGLVRSNSRTSTSTPVIRANGDGKHATPVDSVSLIRHLRRRIRYLHMADLAFPSASTIQKTPSLRNIPSTETVARLAKELLDIASRADAVIADNHVEEIQAQYQKLKDDLGTAQTFLPRLEALAGFDTATRAADSVFGKVMVAMDEEASHAPAEEALIEARTVLRSAEVAAEAVETDRRVVSELKRLRAVWADISSSIEIRNGAESGRQSVLSRSSVMSASDFSGTSEASSIISAKPSTARSRPLGHGSSDPRTNLGIRAGLRKATSSERDVNGTPSASSFRPAPSQHTPNTSGSRASSNPFPRLAQTTESYRNRTLSGSGTGTRPRQDSTSSLRSATSELNHSSSSRGTPKDREAISTAPRAFAQATRRLAPRNISSPLSSIPSRERNISLPSGSAPKMRAKGKVEEEVYVPDPKSTLDQAVGRIVNKLNMNVPVVPVNLDGTDDWKDQSGRYWIGAHGRAKLCYCRILRSRTVMVRVGGGWVELSKFLMDHFAESVWQLPFDDLASGLVGNSPQVITSATLAAQMISDTSFPAASVQIEQPSKDGDAEPDPTPTKAAQPADPQTPQRTTNGIPRSSTFSATKSRSLHAASLSLSLSRSNSGLSRSSSFGLPGSGGQSGPGSPLTPHHFMRKASESPPVREREKERLGAGRRSILGKEGV